MLKSFHKLSSRSLAGPIRDVIFFILFYLYLWLVVETHLIYHGAGMVTNFPVFFRGWVFFSKFLSYPGGPVEYLSAFLAQFFYYSWAGAIVATLQGWLICACVDYFLKTIKAPRFLRWVRFVPPILLLITYNHYTYHFTTTMALLTALAFVCLYLKIVPRKGLIALAVFLILSVICYTIAGGAYLLFAVLCAIYELFWTKRWQMAIACLLSVLAIPYIEGVLIYSVSIFDAFSNLLPLSWKISLYALRKRMIMPIYVLYLFLPLLVLLLGLLPKKLGKKPRSKSPEHGRGALGWIIESLVLFVIAGAVALHSHDNKLKILFEVDYYTCYEKWSQALEAAQRYPGNNFFVAHSTNLALYHTGRLGYDMFSYWQHPHSLFLADRTQTFAHWEKFDAYLNVGFINIAEHELTETMEQQGRRPIILKRLALINMVKANSGTAQVYLNALSKTLFDADWADGYLALIESDPNLSTDNRVQRLRSRMTRKDYSFSSFGNEQMLLDLLEQNRQNHAAFECLMALYLLATEFDEFVQNLDRLNDFDYRQVPRHYEEAVLVYEFNTKKQVDLGSRSISSQSRQRFKDFVQVLSRYGGNKRTAFNELAENYGDTYFFYSLYGTSGTKR